MELSSEVAAERPVAIVGASAAGLFTAAGLARAGRKVRVFERADKINPASRTLIVTSRMRDLLGPAAEHSVVNQINRFELFTDGRSATVPLQEPDLIVERAKLIQGLAEDAQKAGVKLEMGRRFARLLPGEEGLELTVERTGAGARAVANERIQCSAVVGADGAQSAVAQAAGWNRQPTAPRVQALVGGRWGTQRAPTAPYAQQKASALPNS